MSLAVIAIVFGAIFVVELPDKTFIAALVLSTRYKPLAVWIGVGLAFFVQTLIAVLAGHLTTYLPDSLIESVALVIFLAGAVLLFRQAPKADAEEAATEEEYAARATESRTGLKAVTASFLVLFAAEWGDLSQLLTISMIARYGHPRQRLPRRLGRAARGLRPRRARRPGAARPREALGDPLRRRRGVPGAGGRHRRGAVRLTYPPALGCGHGRFD